MEITVRNTRFDDANHERAFRAWARTGSIVFALITLLSMAYSANWKLGMMVSDPLVWMMVLVAMASGLVSGYALGVRLHAGQGA